MDRPKIEKGIPMPSAKGGKWAWINELEVGDSFVLPAGQVPAVRRAARRGEIKFAPRSVTSGEFRVWRID